MRMRAAALREWLACEDNTDVELSLPEQPTSRRDPLKLPLLVTFRLPCKQQLAHETASIKCIVLGFREYEACWVFGVGELAVVAVVHLAPFPCPPFSCLLSQATPCSPCTSADVPRWTLLATLEMTTKPRPGPH